MMLDDVKIVDLTHVQAGPMCTMFLSCMGAEVVKVEPPWGEMLRGRPDEPMTPTFAYFNRNKRGVTLNLKSEKAKEVFLRLVAKGDVVVENFTPSTMERLDLGYKRLIEVNPRIVYASMSGFGHSGPYTNRGSFDLIAQAMSGIMALTGKPFNQPVRIQDYLADSVTALFGTIAILGALRQRDLTGRGQFIDIAQFDCMVSVVPSTVSYLNKREEPAQQDFRGIYDAVKASNGYVAIAAMRDPLLKNLAATMGVERIDSRDVIDAWASRRTVGEIVDALVKADIPCAPVLSTEQVVTDPQFKARHMAVEVEQTGIGLLRLLGFPLKFSAKEPVVDRPAPLLGQHTAEVLRELGYEPLEIESMKKEGAI